MLKGKDKSTGWELGYLVSVIAILGAIYLCFKVYYDVQQLIDKSGNQQAEIEQLQRKVKELSSINSNLVNQINLPYSDKKTFIDELKKIDIDWYVYTNEGNTKNETLVPNSRK
ncbi:hypothetical protein [Legionella cherrii]|uniref:Cell division protein FtsL n=1 Tax=Legionella cherrii TaxID=28084 RepID=A0ABY6T4Z6_9GAMM|nr:hypothetical protein [Legionella cherrii]VEB35517.1 Uncharacterised protein [Legionella cherrii]